MLLTDEILRDPYIAAGLWGQITLDELVAKWAVANPEKIALVDPSNLNFDGVDTPRRLDWKGVENAVNAVAEKLVSLGLKPDDIVAWQCDNRVEAPIVMLGIMRAKMIAVPLPPLWDCADIAPALQQISPKAIIAGSPSGDHDFALTARDVAVEVFSIRHVLGFGANVPDGVLGIDDIFDAHSSDRIEDDREDKAEHVATMCWWVGEEKLPQIMARSHNHWIAAALGPVMEAQITERDVILSANYLTGIASISTILVPWLLSGSKLVLHHAFDRDIFFQQAEEEAATIAVLPGKVANHLAVNGQVLPVSRVINIWPDLYGSRQVQLSDLAAQSSTMVDVFALGETAIFTKKRFTNTHFGRIPSGKIPLPSGADDPPCLLEVRVKGRAVKAGGTETLLGGEIQVSGPMVPARMIGDAQQRRTTLEQETYRYTEGFIGTNIQCRVSAVDPDFVEPVLWSKGIICLGGMHLSIASLEAVYRKFEFILDVAIYGIDDPLFGQRIGVFAVVDSKLNLDTRSLLALITETGIASYKIPEQIDIVPNIARLEDGSLNLADLQPLLKRLAG
ncbi:MAG: acyl--CoA ligase [Rhizobiales bacterium]|nr:acyl--CoA ligase [Hyphomicrobiales bacterium]